MGNEKMERAAGIALVKTVVYASEQGLTLRSWKIKIL